MNKHQRTWSKTEKLDALDLMKKEGSASAARKVGVSITSLYKWQKQYDQFGDFGLEKSRKENKNKEILRLERENAALKKIVAEKELELRIQKEMLKKSH